jgi:hypothetical protein
MSRIIKYKTKEEAVINKKNDDRLFYDPYLNEYFIIASIKKTWKEEEFEDNFIMMPETFEECKSLRSANCQDCEYLPQRFGSYRNCRRRVRLSNRAELEIF